jgi:quinol monooxygenase YgiN
MGTAYTQGVWQVKPGRTEEFVAVWIEFADWTSANVEGSRTLFRDLADDHRFVSGGAWPDIDAIERWRNMAGWSDHMTKLRQLVVRFEPATLEVVAEGA